MKKIVCFSGGKDSTAMLIHLIKSKAQIDDILYVDCGDWIWESAQEHIKQVEDVLGVNIIQLDVSDELRKGFLRWGFPSFFNRWCTGIKREAMKAWIKENYRERERALCNTLVIAVMKIKGQVRNCIPVMMLNIH